ncbi:MAG: glycine--tRNA ligase [Verrucomicrobiota bacterium]
MAEPKSNELMEKIVSLCKRRGFIFQSSEIYGGINGFWDYGPLGAELKRNVKELWLNTMLRQRDDVVGLDATIIMSPEIWKASGHVDTFADLMRECPLTKKRVRADQVEPQSGRVVRFAGAFKKPAETTPVSGTTMEGSPAHLAIEIWLKRTQQPLASLSQKDLANAILDLAKEDTIGEDRAVSYAEVGLAHLVTTSFAVLLAAGKPIESAIKTAVQFYEGLGFKEVFPICVEQPQLIENSTEFHPDSLVELGAPRPFNLMFKTHYGPIESEENIAYLRPETAQAIFVQFKNVFETSRQKVPFGIAQVGKAFRNEVTPRNFTFRSREFEQMEMEFFIRPDEAVEAIQGAVTTVSATGHPGEPQPNWGWQAWHQYWVQERVKFYEGIGLSRDTLGFHIQTPEELAHYARATTDILYKFPFSKKDEQGNVVGDELEGIAARSDFDLSQHERFSGKAMGVFDEELRGAWGKLDDAKKQELSQRYYEARLKYLIKTGVEPAKAEKQARENADGLAKGSYIPHVIEPSAGVDRLILALISNAYSEVTETDAKGKSETRVVLKFHPRVAPIKVAVFPLLKNKPELVNKAVEIRNRLRAHMNAFYDDGGSIGRRYSRQDEIGTPFCVTIDFDTLGEKPELLDTVTLRDRDTMQQTRVKTSDLLPLLLEKIR